MVNDTGCTTLWETWKKGDGPWEAPPPTTSYNHGWSGGPLTLLSKYAAGVAPETPAYETYHVFPQEGDLISISATIPTIKGNIRVSIDKYSGKYHLSVVSPEGATAIVGIPKAAFGSEHIRKIIVNGVTVWHDCDYSDTMTGVSPNTRERERGNENEIDKRYIKFNVTPGVYDFYAYPNP